MDNQDKIEERKRSNGRFLSAFDYTKKCLGMTQEELAKKMGKNGSLISDYRSGKKRVSRETMLELTKVTRNGLSLDYMLGLSNHMIGDATDESCGSQQMQAMPYSEYDDFEQRIAYQEKDVVEMTPVEDNVGEDMVDDSELIDAPPPSYEEFESNEENIDDNEFETENGETEENNTLSGFVLVILKFFNSDICLLLFIKLLK